MNGALGLGDVSDLMYEEDRSNRFRQDTRLQFEAVSSGSVSGTEGGDPELK
jgi:hypothetical protein